MLPSCTCRLSETSILHHHAHLQETKVYFWVVCCRPQAEGLGRQRGDQSLPSVVCCKLQAGRGDQRGLREHEEEEDLKQPLSLSPGDGDVLTGQVPTADRTRGHARGLAFDWSLPASRGDCSHASSPSPTRSPGASRSAGWRLPQLTIVISGVPGA